MKNEFSRREFLQTSSGALIAANTVFLDTESFASPRPVPASNRIRLGIIGIGMQGSGLLSTAINFPVSNAWLPATCTMASRTGERNRRQQQSPDHPPLSGTARQQGYRLPDRRRSRPLAQAGRGRCRERGQRCVLRKTHVPHSGRGIRHGRLRRRRLDASCRSDPSASVP